MRGPQALDKQHARFGLRDEDLDHHSSPSRSPSSSAADVAPLFIHATSSEAHTTRSYTEAQARGDLSADWQRLKAAGVQFVEEPTDYGNLRIATLKDPEGRARSDRLEPRMVTSRTRCHDLRRHPSARTAGHRGSHRSDVSLRSRARDADRRPTRCRGRVDTDGQPGIGPVPQSQARRGCSRSRCADRRGHCADREERRSLLRWHDLAWCAMHARVCLQLANERRGHRARSWCCSKNVGPIIRDRRSRSFHPGPLVGRLRRARIPG